MIIVYIMI